MRVTALSDLHGYYPKLPGGDLLILAGDLTKRDSISCWDDFFFWFKAQQYTKKIMVGGNHDRAMTLWSNNTESKLFYEKYGYDPAVIYNDNEVFLRDSSTEFEGFKIWGSPWTKNFDGQNPQAMAFGVDSEKELYDKFVLIPHDTNILITHSPPFGILDAVAPHQKMRYGSTSLLEIVEDVKPRYHFFGHIHECGGKSYETGMTKFYNVAYVNSRYRPRSHVLTLEINPQQEVEFPELP